MELKLKVEELKRPDGSPKSEAEIWGAGRTTCEAPPPVDVSHSELRTFNRCRGKWFLKYVRCLRPSSTKPRLSIGGIFHDALADLHSPAGETPMEARNIQWFWDRVNVAYSKKIPADGDPNGKVLETLKDLSRIYFKWGPQTRKPYYATEVNFRLPIWLLDQSFEPVAFAGFIHGRLDVVEALEDGLWVVDYKTKDRFTFKGIETDLQMSLYCVAGAKLFGREFRGARLRYVRTEISKSSANYADVPIVKSPQELRSIENNLGVMLRSLGLTTRETICWNFTRDCTWDCDYREPCVARAMGQNFEMVLRRDYVVLPDRDDSGSETQLDE